MFNTDTIIHQNEFSQGTNKYDVNYVYAQEIIRRQLL